MRYVLILLLLSVGACKPRIEDSLYFRHCKHTCLRAGHLHARVIETETQLHCQCSNEGKETDEAEKEPDKGPT